MPNGEVIKFPGGAGDYLIDPSNETVHFPVQVVKEMIHFLVRPLHDQLDPAIRQISHVAAHVILHRQICYCVSKPHPLNPSAESTFAAMFRMGRLMHVANITRNPFGHQYLIYRQNKSLHLELLGHFVICDFMHELLISLLSDEQILAKVVLQKWRYARGIPSQIAPPQRSGGVVDGSGGGISELSLQGGPIFSVLTFP